MENKFLIDPEILKRLSKQDYLKSISMIAFDWIAVAAIIAVAQTYFNPLIYIIAVMLIGNRQHGLLILMHDSSHLRFSRNKTLNDWTGELLTAWPLFIRMKAYREKHLAHHKYSNTSEDPDFRIERYPTTRKEIFISLLKDAFALNTLGQLEEIKRLRTETTTGYKIARALFYLVLITAITLLGAWKIYLMYWIVPAFTWLKVCLRVRAYADHTGVQNREVPFDTRTVIPNLFDRLFLAPHGCSYHLGHHIYAAVPCHGLKELHLELIKNPEVASKAHFTDGFFEFFNEFPRDKKDIKNVQDEKGINLTDNMPPRVVLNLVR